MYSSCCWGRWAEALFEEFALGHVVFFEEAAVVVFAAAALFGEHGAGACGVLGELQVVVDGEGTGHGLYVEVVGADEGEGPALGLELLYHVTYQP